MRVGSKVICTASTWPVPPADTCSYEGCGTCPPVYPAVVVRTPARCSNGGCMHQKQPPANVAVAAAGFSAAHKDPCPTSAAPIARPSASHHRTGLRTRASSTRPLYLQRPRTESFSAVRCRRGDPVAARDPSVRASFQAIAFVARCVPELRLPTHAVAVQDLRSDGQRRGERRHVERGAATLERDPRLPGVSRLEEQRLHAVRREIAVGILEAHRRLAPARARARRIARPARGCARV